MWWWWWYAALVVQRPLSSFSSSLFHWISFDFRCSGSVNRPTSVHKAVPHSHTIMRTTRSVHYFCRSWYFFSFTSCLFFDLYTSYSSPFEIDPIVAFIIWWIFFLALSLFTSSHAVSRECRIIIMTALLDIKFRLFFYFPDFQSVLIDLTFKRNGWRGCDSSGSWNVCQTVEHSFGKRFMNQWNRS